MNMQDDTYRETPEARYCMNRICNLIGRRSQLTDAEQHLVNTYNCDLLKAKLKKMTSTERDRAMRTIKHLET